MTVHELADRCHYTIICSGKHMEDEISEPYCCDLLSIAMSQAPAGAAWVTVMSNINTLAVASLTESACIILSCNTKLDDTAAAKAGTEGITVLATTQATFPTALEVYQKLHE